MTAIAGFNAANCVVPAIEPTIDVSIILNKGIASHTPTAGKLNLRISRTDGTLYSCNTRWDCCWDWDWDCCDRCDCGCSLLLLIIFFLLPLLALYQSAVSAVDDAK